MRVREHPAREWDTRVVTAAEGTLLVNNSLAASLLVIAAGIAVNPPGIIVQLGLLSAQNGRRKALAYLAGLFVSLLAFAVVAVIVFGRFDLTQKGSVPTTAHYVIFALGGLVVLGVGIWLWRQPAEAVGGFIGKALEDLDHVKLSVAFLLGFLLVNYPLELVGATTILQAKLPTAEAIAYYLGFVVVASSTIWLPMVLAVAMPRRWERWSDAIKRWTVAEGNVVLGLLIVAIGVLVTAQGVLGLLK